MTPQCISPDIMERLRIWRKRMPAVWYGNADLDAAIAEIERLRGVAQNPVMPAKLTGELACIIECCDPPEHQTDEAVERLIFDYQPMWDRLRAALVPLQERGGK